MISSHAVGPIVLPHACRCCGGELMSDTFTLKGMLDREGKGSRMEKEPWWKTKRGKEKKQEGKGGKGKESGGD